MFNKINIKDIFEQNIFITIQKTNIGIDEFD
jgi:hypothetical protein